jgi:hypothetical protein
MPDVLMRLSAMRIELLLGIAALTPTCERSQMCCLATPGGAPISFIRNPEEQLRATTPADRTDNGEVIRRRTGKHFSKPVTHLRCLLPERGARR